MSLYLGDQQIAGVSTPIQGARNIGQLIFSLIPLTDAGLHLADGTLIDGSGVYSAFYNYMLNLYGDGTNPPNYFTDETSWQSSVTTYGVCGKFVINTTNQTIRLPKITGIVEGTLDANALGDLVEAGLPNITGSLGNQNVANETLTGCFDKEGNVSAGNYATGSYFLQKTIFDASKSDPIYDNSDTVQPQTIKGYYYIVIATSPKTDIQVDIDQIVTDLNNKADKDLSNATVPHIVEMDSDNNGSWYKLYSNNWVEQGGISSNNSGSIAELTISLLKAFNNTKYIVVATQQRNTVSSDSYPRITAKTTTTIKLSADTNSEINWIACGYKA